MVLLTVERCYLILNLQIGLTLHKESEFVLTVCCGDLRNVLRIPGIDFFSFKSPYDTGFASTLKRFTH